MTEPKIQFTDDSMFVNGVRVKCYAKKMPTKQSKPKKECAFCKAMECGLPPPSQGHTCLTEQTKPMKKSKCCNAPVKIHPQEIASELKYCTCDFCGKVCEIATEQECLCCTDNWQDCKCEQTPEDRINTISSEIEKQGKRIEEMEKQGKGKIPDSFHKPIKSMPSI